MLVTLLVDIVVQVYFGEFNYLFRTRRARLAAGRRFRRSDHPGKESAIGR